MSSDNKIIKSKLVLKKYPYDSLIELLVDRLKTDSEKGCLVSTDTFPEKRQFINDCIPFHNTTKDRLLSGPEMD